MSRQSKLGSILFSTAFVVAFGLLAGPVIKTGAGVRGGIEVREPAQPSAHLRVEAGKSVIMESPVKIVRASVENPEIARTVSIDEHELLVNGRAAGRTNVTVWQADGQRRQFDLDIDNMPHEPRARVKEDKPAADGRGLTAAYQDAMARVQTAITGVDR